MSFHTHIHFRLVVGGVLGGRRYDGLKGTVLRTICFVSLTAWFGVCVKAQQGRRPTPSASSSISVRHLFPVVHDHKWGYIDGEGKLTISYRFDFADDFSEGLARIMIHEKDGHDKYGYIDESGRIVIEPQFTDFSGAFSEGVAAVQISSSNGTVDEKCGVMGGKWGFIDTLGRFVINPQYDCAKGFSAGLAAVRMHPDDGYGYIDHKGNSVVPARFKYAESFSDGLAFVQTRDGEQGFINKRGTLVIKGFKDRLGFMSIVCSRYSPGDKHSGGGFCCFSCSFRDGLVQVSDRKNEKYGYINRTGHLAVTLQFEAEQVFSDGLAAVSISGKYGYINKTGKFVINPKFDDAFPFSEGRALVFTKGVSGRAIGYIDMSYIDEKGKYIITPQPIGDGRLNPWLGPLWGFRGGLALIVIEQRLAYIDKHGKVVWKEE